jgi:hypothetical protein
MGGLMNEQLFICEGLQDHVFRDKDNAVVIAGKGYSIAGKTRCELKNTGNGYIAHFASHCSHEQDNYVCMSYDQAQALVMALSAFKKELGFE